VTKLVINWQKWAKTTEMSTFFFTHYLRNQNTRNVEIGTNVARGVRMMPKLFVFKLCTALIFNCGKISSPKPANSKKCEFLFHSHGGTTFMQKQRIHSASVQVDSQHATSDDAQH